jgi:hypothetical protein
MTRGMKGCYVFCTDRHLRHLRDQCSECLSRLLAVNTAPLMAAEDPLED